VLRRTRRADEGFTLIELLIVVVVTPIIVGSLAAGLIAMLSLQQGVTSRLSNSEDSQMVQASYRNDVQSAQQITTASNTAADPNAPECGTGYQVLGLEWNFNPTTHLYQTVVSYVSVPVVNGTTTTYSLVRQECTNVTSPATNITPVTSTTTISSNLAANLAASELTPTIQPSTAGTSASTAE
jgi:type II secretory pathway pseudopilin PulG